MKRKKIILFAIFSILLILFSGIYVAAIPIPRGLYYRLTPSEKILVRNNNFPDNYSNQLENVSLIPQHPFMALNGQNNMHCDGYMSDVTSWSGPLGVDPYVQSSFRGIAECVTVCFTSDGQMVTGCTSLSCPRLVLLDPVSLKEIARYDLPGRPRFSFLDPIGLLEDTSGGAYFYLDNLNRVVVATHEQSIEIVQILENGQGFELVERYDLSDYVVPLDFPERDKVGSVLPDWQGNLWFVTRYGAVGVINVSSKFIKTMELFSLESNIREEIQNSFTVGEDGIYIVSDHAMYCFNLDENDDPVILWRATYDRGTRRKPGMLNQGSGTTPTLIGDLVVIGDNADPRMNMLFYHRIGGKLACSIPVFEEDKSCAENAPIGIAFENGICSVVVINSYGHKNFLATTLGRVTEKGIVRIDVKSDGVGGYSCQEVWSSEEYPCSALPKLSVGNGMMYIYTKTPAFLWPNPWYFTAIDFRTGETVYQLLAGSGFGFNNNWGPISIGPDGTAYVGMLFGIISVRDDIKLVPSAGSNS